MEKTYISAQQLLDDSFRLALTIFESGYKPDYIVGVWRGGAPVGIAVQELLDFLGVKSDHIAIRTSSYTGINERSRHVTVHGLNYIVRRVHAEDSVLIVDDVHDTGLSIHQVIHDLTKACKKNTPDIKIATPYFKPGNNKTKTKPDFYVHKTDSWLVFPHELHGLTLNEISEKKPGMDAIRERLLLLKEKLK
ncbi:MAG: hypoxanthine phosphoribosyltransferase [Spongiibacteraceae bacterium]|nr:hypoxanthine phosphoribosyltransferase [Spongiibacteraceae bacterium]